MRNATNPELHRLIQLLKKAHQENDVGIWRSVADYLSKSRQRRVTINVSRLNRYTQSGMNVIVPGKVLGAGKIDHPLFVAAFSFSEQARKKIFDAKGKCLSIDELILKKPKGAKVQIIG